MLASRLYTDRDRTLGWGLRISISVKTPLTSSRGGEMHILFSSLPLILPTRKLCHEDIGLAQCHTISAQIPTRMVTPTTLACSQKDHVPQNSDLTRNHHSLQGNRVS